MDLGIAGKKALVCAASKGLGRGCAEALAEAGVNVTICSRTEKDIKSTAELISSRYNIEVKSIACDITTSSGREAALKEAGSVDILINNAGGPPPGNYKDWDRDDWIKAIDANMLTGIELIKSTLDDMISRKFGRIINITSAAVKSPIAILGLSNGARMGLTGFCAGISRETVRNGVTINGLLPGPFDTDRLRSNIKVRADAVGKSYDDMYKTAAAENPAGRFGTAEEFGKTCAFLCSAHAGFINGQNILMDGGAFRSSL
ncbi:MAG: 3-oxoacyl-ACP reductase [Rhodospirillaceae bacterium]|nr:3-oxoacyl-ACP reductase [Rhodospirillaceae bacterium]|tara:strand:+ start:431 stop:1210 length:780 start_codon:yes stop_codon:yes gene_type:complete